MPDGQKTVWTTFFLFCFSDLNLFYSLGETGAKRYTGQNDTARFSNDDAIYDRGGPTFFQGGGVNFFRGRGGPNANLYRTQYSL